MCRLTGERRGLMKDENKKEFYQKLWEINCKLEELKDTFVSFAAPEKENREWADSLGDLERAYSKIIGLVHKKRGLPEVSFPAMTNEDVKWVLGIAGAKDPPEIARLKKHSKGG